MCSKVLGRTPLLLMTLFIGAAAVGSVRASFLPDGVDLLFSTSTPSVSFKNGFQYLGPGSILSTNGSVIATNQSLLAKFKPQFNFVPIFNDKGLDAMAVMGSSRRKTIVFSVNKGFYSTALHRYISDGDLISNQGEVVASQQDLLAAFEPKNPTANYGLDAVYIRSSSGLNGKPEIWFSTARSFYSNKLGRTIGSGDIISNDGEVVVTFDDLIKNFAPRGNTASLGLDSCFAILDDKGKVGSYVFSTSTAFYSNTLKRWVGANDLISSDGTMAMTQRQITQNFGLIVPICKNLVLDAAAFNVPTYEERRTPEPASLSLLALGLVGLVRRRR